MKRKMFFIIVSVLLMLAVTVYMGINLQKGSQKSFTKAGYILNTTVESGNEKDQDEGAVKYYFSDNTVYKNSLNETVEFKDTNGKKVKVSEASFIHYEDDSIGLLKKGVILNLENINTSVPIYYNLFEGTVLQYNNGTYSVDNLGKTLKFNKFICRVSDNKYLLVDDDIKLKLDDNTSTDIKSNYVEISVVEEGIIRIENQDASYSTVATDASIEIGDDLSLNLDNGYFFYKEEPIVNLNSMIIDSDDNIDITPIEEIKDQIEKEKEQEEQNAQEGGSNSNNGNGSTGENVSEGADAAAGDAGSTVITETEVVENELTLPTASLSDVDITANVFQGSISISDPDSIITGTTYTTVAENSTGRVVFERETDAGIYAIDVFAENLIPETSYTLTTNIHYTKNEIEYTMDVVQQLFVTSSIGITIEKDYYTSSELSFNVKIDDYSRVKSADVKLLSSTGEVLDVQPVTAETAKNSSGLPVVFAGLNSNTKYTVLVDNILYNDQVIGDEYSIEIPAKTLKLRPSMGTPSFTIDKKNGAFTIKLNNMVDSNGGVDKYIYEIYDARTLSSNPQPVVTYEKGTLSSLDLAIDDSTIKRGVPYTYKVTALFYDNEKYIEYSTGYSPNMQMDGVESPTLSWTTDDENGGVTFEAINGFITITDPAGTIDYDKPMTIVYTNSIGTTKSYTVTSGNSIIPFNQRNLRANETYTISVYASVNLMDDNAAIDSYHVGSVIVRTNPTKPIEVFYNVDTESVTDAFNIQAKLLNVNGADNTLEASTLSELTFLLYDGPTTTGTVVKRIRRVDRDEREYYSTLKSDYYDKTFTLNASFFNLTNTDLTSEFYTIQIIDAKDYTDFKNEIPLVNSTVTFAVNGFVDDPDPDSKKWFTTSIIRNKDAGAYGKYDENLNAETVVGIKLNANFDNTKHYGVYLNYYVWDYTYGWDNAYEIPEQRQTANFASDGTIEPVYYWFEYGTDNSLDDKNTGKLYRGHSYYFSFTGGLDLNNDGIAETRYPTSADKVLKSDGIDFNKQDPTIRMYPASSTNTSYTLNYYLKDVDKALIGNMLDCSLYGKDDSFVKAVSKPIEVTEGDLPKSVTFDNLVSDNFMYISSDYLSVKGGEPKRFRCIEQYYDKQYTLPKINYTLMVDVNRVIISINNYDSLTEAMNQIAALKITFLSNGKSIVKDFVKLNGDNAVVDMYDLAEFLGQPVTVKVEAYYDNNLVGWNAPTDYVALQAIKDVYGGGEYFTLNSNNFLVESDIARGSIYKKTETGNYVDLALKGTSYKYRIDFFASNRGIRSNGTYLNLKYLDTKELNTTNNSFTFYKIIPGISLENDDGVLDIAPAIQSVNFKADVYGFGSTNIKDSKVYVQVSNTDESGSYITPIGDPIEFSVEDINSGVCEIPGLQPKTYYALEFYAYIDNGQGAYEYTKLYDLDDNSDRRIYYFKTLSSVGITDIASAYTAVDYETKNIIFTYNLDRIMGYDKIEYKLYKQVANPATGSYDFVDAGIEIPDDTGFKSSMVKSVPCPPGSSWDFGSVYYLTIIPYVESKVGGTTEWIALDETIGSYRFNLRKLRNPYVGVSASIYTGEGIEGSAIDFKVTLYDTDSVVVNSRYNIEVSELNDDGTLGNDVTPSKYAGNAYEISRTRRSFIVDNLIEGKSYQFTVIYYEDINNKGTAVRKEYKFKANALNPDSISVGTISAVQNATNKNKIDLNFTNSYRLTNIQNLRYSIYNSLDGSSFDNDIEFTVKPKNVNGTIIYTITLPESLKTQGIYAIQLQFIADDKVVEEQTIDYSYFL